LPALIPHGRLDPAGNKSVNIVNYKLGKCARHFPNLLYKPL